MARLIPTETPTRSPASKPLYKPENSSTNHPGMNKRIVKGINKRQLLRMLTKSSKIEFTP